MAPSTQRVWHSCWRGPGGSVAGEARRQQALAVVLFWTLAFLWGLSGVLILVLPTPDFLDGPLGYFWAAFYPAGLFFAITGMGAGVLYSGAFDIRPVISRTTVYGTLLLTLTVLFALVEELAESLLTERLDLPDGVGVVLGALAVAVVVGPLQARLEASFGGRSDTETD